MAFLKIVDHRGNRIPVPKQMGSAYEAAGSGRRLGSWGTSNAGPNNTLFSSLNTLRARSRELVRNDPQIDGGMDALVANLVGTGITPRWQIEDSDLKAQIQELWADWTKEADADEVCDFYGLQALAARSMIENGEVFVRFRPRRPEDGLSVPLQLQILESDHLDESYTTTAQNGNEIRMGIEFNRIGKRVAYHMFREHPGESFLTVNQSERVRIPASEILHLYRPLRAGQKRGRPWLSSVIVAMHELNQFNDAELVRKKTAAMFGGFITEPPGEYVNTSPLGKKVDDDSEGRDVVAIEPGTFPVLPPGLDVKFSTPADVGGSYEAFVKHQERRVARGFGSLTYEKFTGDLEGVTYSSIRSGNLEFQRFCLMIIYNVLAFQFCRPVAEYWLKLAILSKALDLPGYAGNRRKYHRIKWCVDGWPWVDPEKDLKAEKAAIRSGLKSRAESVAERGRDVEEVDREIAEDNNRADKLGLILDTDPRKTDQKGSKTEEETKEDEK